MQTHTTSQHGATFDASDPLNAIVARYPQTLPVFHQLGLDTCCGGTLPLGVAAEHHQLDLDQVIALLEAVVDKDAS